VTGSFNLEYDELVGKPKRYGRSVFRKEEAVWYWSCVEVEVENADHACGPDCICHQHVQQLRGEVTEMKRLA